MSSGVTHDSAARILGLTPGELEKLVAAGHVRRNDKNAYPAPTFIQDYIAFLKSGQAVKLTQADIAAHLDVSDRTIRELQIKLNLPENYTLEQIRVAYIRHLREQAAGRMSEDGELDLVQERAGLAREQRIAQELKNAETKKEYAPVGLLSMVLSRASQSVADELESLPSNLKKSVDDLPEAAIAVIDETCRRARNNWLHATSSFDEGFGLDDDSDSEIEQDISEDEIES